MNYRTKVLVIIAIFAIALTLFCFIVTTTSTPDKELIWNNGIHANCGGHWHIVARTYDAYVYECDTCYASFEAYKNYSELEAK